MNTIVEGRRAWWSRAVLMTGIVAVVLPFLGALGTRFGSWNFQIGLLMWAGGLLIGLICVIAGIVALFAVRRPHRAADRRPVFVGTALAVVMVLFLGAQLAGARGVPPIHDITTDVADPPQFDAAVKLRGESPDINTLAYDAEKLPPLQQAAYPNVVPLDVSATPEATFDAAAAALAGLGFEVVNADKDAMRIEAVDTTFWFGFKDDVVVRIRPQATGSRTGSRIDVRSVSRVGVGDAGTNARRIEKILGAIKAKVA
jgi:uncharacterized protein (DUF1499 family)